MKQIKVSVDQLKRSEHNVRSGHSKEDIANMANSITHRGLINPPTVAVNGDGTYKVLAGQLRVAGAIAAGLTEIDAFDASDLTPAERIALSLSENVDRRDMTDIERYKAYNQLFKAGVSIENIAAQFNKEQNHVRRILAIGCLPKKILDLAEAEEIGDRELRLFAIAPREKITEFTKLKPKDRPSRWKLEGWLKGNDQWYPVTNALFDISEYKGPIVTDLFSDKEHEYFADGPQFWQLQDAALQERLAAFEKKNWKVKKIDYFRPWAYDKVKKSDGGMVLYTIDRSNGRIEFHVGYKIQQTATKEKTAKNDGEKPEISGAFADYMADIRHQAVCNELISDNKKVLATTLFLLLRQADNLNFRFDGWRSKGEGYCKDLTETPFFKTLDKERTAMEKDLDFEFAGVWQLRADEIMPVLLRKTEAKLIHYIGVVVADRWSIKNGSEISDFIAKSFGLDVVKDYEITEQFWKGITNKKTMLAIAKENNITVNKEASGSSLRQVLRSQIDKSWRPKWLKF